MPDEAIDESSLQVLLKGVVGSTAYGLATTNSDIDTLGIYCASWEEILGLGVAGAVDNTFVDKSPYPDKTLHEVGKFIHLALKCNPTILELLFLDNYTHITDAGGAIIDIKSAFIFEKGVRGAYGSYAVAQARRLASRADEDKKGFGSVPLNRVAKHARHCGRLLYLGQQLLATGEMNLDCSSVREDLFDLGLLATEDVYGFQAEFERRLRDFDDVKSVLPDYPDRELANRTLINIRYEALQRGGIG